MEQDEFITQGSYPERSYSVLEIQCRGKGTWPTSARIRRCMQGPRGLVETYRGPWTKIERGPFGKQYIVFQKQRYYLEQFTQ